VNDQERDDKLERILAKVEEIDDALLGTYVKKGFISRVRSLEKVVKYGGTGLVFVLTTVSTVLIRGWMGV